MVPIPDCTSEDSKWSLESENHVRVYLHSICKCMNHTQTSLLESTRAKQHCGMFAFHIRQQYSNCLVVVIAVGVNLCWTLLREFHVRQVSSTICLLLLSTWVRRLQVYFRPLPYGDIYIYACKFKQSDIQMKTQIYSVSVTC